MVLFTKLVNLLAQPLNAVLLLLVVALLVSRRKPRWARRMHIAAAMLLALSGVTAIPEYLIGQLESRSPESTSTADWRGYEGLIVLGGAMESGRISAQHQQPLLNGGAERMTQAFALWRANPALKVVFTGGEGEYFGTGPSEAARAQRFFADMGMPASALTLEDQSQNTYENALFTRKLPGIDPGKRWLLVTSAWHMPRALATFQKAGWNVTPYPVDFRTGGVAPWSDYSLRDGPQLWELLLHECIGLVAYRLTGRI